MSGGSWDYLYSRCHDVYWDSTFEDVAHRLEQEKGLTLNAIHAAAEAAEIARLFKTALSKWEGLRDVLHEMEWVDSGDSDTLDLAAAIDKWAAGRTA